MKMFFASNFNLFCRPSILLPCCTYHEYEYVQKQQTNVKSAYVFDN